MDEMTMDNHLAEIETHMKALIQGLLEARDFSSASTVTSALSILMAAMKPKG